MSVRIEGEMLEEGMPGRRVTTQNLFMSAAVFEYEQQIKESSLHDLSVLIDLFCLYDRCKVLGRQSWSAIQKLNTNVSGLLEEQSFIDIVHPDWDSVSLVARRHLSSFLGQEEVEKYDRLLRIALSPSEVTYGIEYRPDGVTEVGLGESWLKTASSRESLLRQLGREQEQRVVRGTTYLLRTFLYLAYADIAKLTFTPDATRGPVLERVLRDEDAFLRQHVMKRLQAAWEEYPRSGFLELRRTVSPFAALVFERSKNKDHIAYEMQKLREELKPYRDRVTALEENALWGSRDEAISAERKWQQVLDEIDFNFGQDPRLINIERGIAWSEAIGEIADKPGSWKNWMGLFSQVSEDVVLRLLSRRPAIEIHRLRSELPSPGRLAKSVERLFGQIQPNST